MPVSSPGTWRRGATLPAHQRQGDAAGSRSIHDAIRSVCAEKTRKSVEFNAICDIAVLAPGAEGIRRALVIVTRKTSVTPDGSRIPGTSDAVKIAVEAEAPSTTSPSSSSSPSSSVAFRFRCAVASLNSSGAVHVAASTTATATLQSRPQDEAPARCYPLHLGCAGEDVILLFRDDAACQSLRCLIRAERERGVEEQFRTPAPPDLGAGLPLLRAGPIDLRRFFGMRYPMLPEGLLSDIYARIGYTATTHPPTGSPQPPCSPSLEAAAAAPPDCDNTAALCPRFPQRGDGLCGEEAEAHHALHRLRRGRIFHGNRVRVASPDAWRESNQLEYYKKRDELAQLRAAGRERKLPRRGYSLEAEERVAEDRLREAGLRHDEEHSQHLCQPKENREGYLRLRPKSLAFSQVASILSDAEAQKRIALSTVQFREWQTLLQGFAERRSVVDSHDRINRAMEEDFDFHLETQVRSICERKRRGRGDGGVSQEGGGGFQFAFDGSGAAHAMLSAELAEAMSREDITREWAGQASALLGGPDDPAITQCPERHTPSGTPTPPPHRFAEGGHAFLPILEEASRRTISQEAACSREVILGFFHNMWRLPNPPQRGGGEAKGYTPSLQGYGGGTRPTAAPPVVRRDPCSLLCSAALDSLLWDEFVGRRGVVAEHIVEKLSLYEGFTLGVPQLAIGGGGGGGGEGSGVGGMSSPLPPGLLVDSISRSDSSSASRSSVSETLALIPSMSPSHHSRGGASESRSASHSASHSPPLRLRDDDSGSYSTDSVSSPEEWCGETATTAAPAGLPPPALKQKGQAGTRRPPGGGVGSSIRSNTPHLAGLATPSPAPPSTFPHAGGAVVGGGVVPPTLRFTHLVYLGGVVPPAAPEAVVPPTETPSPPAPPCRIGEVWGGVSERGGVGKPSCTPVYLGGVDLPASPDACPVVTTSGTFTASPAEGGEQCPLQEEEEEEVTPTSPRCAACVTSPPPVASLLPLRTWGKSSAGCDASPLQGAVAMSSLESSCRAAGVIRNAAASHSTRVASAAWTYLLRLGTQWAVGAPWIPQGAAALTTPSEIASAKSSASRMLSTLLNGACLAGGEGVRRKAYSNRLQRPLGELCVSSLSLLTQRAAVGVVEAGLEAMSIRWTQGVRDLSLLKRVAGDGVAGESCLQASIEITSLNKRMTSAVGRIDRAEEESRTSHADRLRWGESRHDKRMEDLLLKAQRDESDISHLRWQSDDLSAHLGRISEDVGTLLLQKERGVAEVLRIRGEVSQEHAAADLSELRVSAAEDRVAKMKQDLAVCRRGGDERDGEESPCVGLCSRGGAVPREAWVVHFASLVAAECAARSAIEHDAGQRLLRLAAKFSRIAPTPAVMAPRRSSRDAPEVGLVLTELLGLATRQAAVRSAEGVGLASQCSTLSTLWGVSAVQQEEADGRRRIQQASHDEGAALVSRAVFLQCCLGMG